MQPWPVSLPRHALLLLIVLLSASCATRLQPAVVTPEIPPPPAALMTVEASASWLSWSARVLDYLLKARQSALDLRPKPPGCAITSPASAKCL